MMGRAASRERLCRHILERYGVEAEQPWARYPGYDVFRHGGNRKWFAMAMTVPRDRLGLPGADEADVLNVKVDPDAAPVLRRQPGILPAYHMNKEHWVTLLLDGSVPAEQVEELLDASYRLTS